MIKLIIVDMDGTFLDDNKQKSPEFEKVFKYLKENDIYFCAASGRQLASLKKEFAGFENDMLFVAENGTVVEFNGEIISCENLSPEVTTKILNRHRYLKDKMMIYCAADCTYLDDLSDEAAVKNAEVYLPSHKYVDDFEEVEDLPVKVSFFSKTGYDKDFQLLVDEFSDLATVCTSGFEWLDIIPKNSNKGRGIKKIQDRLGITAEETMAFGDQMNDFDMLSEAYYSYAMDNAVDEIKQICRFSAPSNNEYGVVQVIKERFGIK